MGVLAGYTAEAFKSWLVEPILDDLGTKDRSAGNEKEGIEENLNVTAEPHRRPVVVPILPTT